MRDLFGQLKSMSPHDFLTPAFTSYMFLVWLDLHFHCQTFFCFEYHNFPTHMEHFTILHPSYYFSSRSESTHFCPLPSSCCLLDLVENFFEILSIMSYKFRFCAKFLCCCYCFPSQIWQLFFLNSIVITLLFCPLSNIKSFLFSVAMLLLLAIANGTLER